MQDQRYARQLVLKEWGQKGQDRLRSARILLVGMGGLGSPAALYLAAAGTGTLGLIDPDQVDVSNLQRQVLYRDADAGRSKVEAAAEHLQALNPELSCQLFAEPLTAANAEAIVANFDLVIDGSDNFAAKFLVNDVCVKLQKPLVYGSILRWEGQLAVFWSPHGPCYRCLFPAPPEDYVPNCAEAGVIGAMAGTIGSLQALEAMKIIVAGEPPYKEGLQPALGRLWLLRANSLETQSLRVPKNPHCPVCSLEPQAITLRDEAGARCQAELGLREYPAASLRESWREFFCIDVREREEWERGHLPGAFHAPLSQLLRQIPQNWPMDSRPWLLYCQGGVRSRRAYDLLKNQGFHPHGHIREGFSAWTGPVE